jgi:Domain of unknown function (DUF222)/HNH endonuclease
MGGYAANVRAATRSKTPVLQGCRGYRLALRNATGERPEDEVETRWVRERETATGLVRFEVQLRPEEAAAIRRALELARERASNTSDVSAGTRHANLQRADALVAIAEQYLTGALDDASDAGPPVEVVIHVEADAEGSGTLDDGTTLAHATTDRLLCDAAVVKVVEDSRGNVLDVGRRRRTIPTLLRRALRLRGGGCQFPGCTNRRVDGHHVVPWSRGGSTALGNLCSLCRRHHGYVHEFGFRLEANGTGGFQFFRPDRSAIPVSATPPEIGPHPIDTLRTEHHARGLAIDAATNATLWDGRPADYGLIVGSLMPLTPP